MTQEKKHCPACGETDLTKFGKDNSRDDKLTVYCLTCKNKKGMETYTRHKERYVAQKKRHRQAHPELYRAYNQVYRQTHRAQVYAHSRAYQQAHPEKTKEYHRRSRAKPGHKEWRRAYEATYRRTSQRKAYFKKWQQENRDKWRGYQRQSYHRRKQKQL